jgi:trimethylamine---corrinoid protein Co-methyltransferase
MVKRGIRGGVFRPLSRSDIEAIHGASLEILEQVGLQVKSKVMVDVFKKGGADVEEKKGRVRIPEYLVKDSLSKVPSKVILGGRTEASDLVLEDGRAYFGLGGTPTPYTLDIESGDFRVSTSNDVVNATVLGDALPNISFVMSLGGASDVPHETAWLHETSLMLRNTEKPIVYAAAGAEGAKHLLAMGAAVAGGFDNLARRPIITLFSEPITPLVMPSINEAVIEFAKARVPVAYAPGPMPGASTPITLAGEHAVCNAECLAGVVLVQLVSPGAPVLYGIHTSVLDMRTGSVCYGAPEWGLGWLIVGQLAEYYGIPTFGSGGATDSKCPDAQAGVEAFMNAFLNVAAGINLIHNCGTIAHGSSGSLEMGVICDEIINYIQRLLMEIEISDETLAVDLIRRIGPAGSFMAEKHTRTHLGRGAILHPKLFNRQAIADWKAKGQLSTRDEARLKAKTILREHKAPALPSEVLQQIDQILGQASQTMTK